MKIIKQFLLITGIVACSFMANAQISSITIDASQLYTTFKYSDTDGSQLNDEYEGIFTGAYSVGYRYITDFGLIIRSGIGMRNGGASMVIDDMNYSWDLKYADVQLGVGYLYKIKKFSPYFVASGYYAQLIRGTQTLNNESFNITESGLLNEMDYGVIFSPGVEFKMSDFISSYLEFTYLLGLNNIEKDQDQNASNVAYGLTLGLSFSIIKK